MIEYAEEFCSRSKGKFELVDVCGAGNSATVFKIKSHEGVMALKIYEPRFFAGSGAVVEKRRIEDQLKLRGHVHPNLIQVYDAGEIRDSWYLLMEYLPWQSLDKAIANVPPKQIWPLIEQLASAARLLEERDFVHRDIKPANILVNREFSDLKLLDLGVLRSISHLEASGTDHGLEKPFVATAQYSSPEYLFRIVEPSIDLWRGLTFYQIGGVLHDLIMREPLFDAEVKSRNRFHLAFAVYTKVPDIANDKVDPLLVALARSCLHKDLRLRLERVSWAHFSQPNEKIVEDARKRLGLGAAKIAKTDLSAQEIDRAKITLAKLSSHLSEWIRDRMLDSGFPRVDLHELELSDSRRAIFVTYRPLHAKAETKFSCVLEIDLVGPGNEGIELACGFALVKNADLQRPFSVKPLWTTSVLQFEADENALMERFDTNLILAYDKAVRTVEMFDAEAIEFMAIEL